jgi:hypothetical protein
MRLVDDAGLQKIAANWRPPTLVDQIKAVWGAARKVNLDADVPCLSFYARALEGWENSSKISQPPRLVFSREHARMAC